MEEDRKIWFCVPRRALRMRPGEFVISMIRDVRVLESWSGDTREYIGCFILSNLRIIWIMAEEVEKTINMSIGHHCITGIEAKVFHSKLSGTNHGMQVRAAHEKNYLFSFLAADNGKNLNELSSQLYAVFKAYSSSTAYRNLMLRSAITTEDDKLCLLPKEEIYNSIDGFWNLSGGFGNLGMLFITNIRMVWFSKANKHYNGSIPYIRMKSIQESQTKYGHTLVIAMLWPYEDLVFAFQVHPEERLKSVVKELQSVRSMALKNPNYGIVMEPRSEIESDLLESEQDPIICEEDTNVDQTFHLNFLSLSSIENEHGATRKPRPPVYSKELGVAVETLPEGFSIQKLWKVI